jgi:hypothetical protein
MWPLLKVGGGIVTERSPAVVASLSSRVASIGNNRLGDWHSYRSSKTALNQCMILFFHHHCPVILNMINASFGHALCIFLSLYSGINTYETVERVYEDNF